MQAPQVFNATVRRIRRTEYDEMARLGFFTGERVELIHGMVVRMPPMGPPHAEIVDRLMKRFVRALTDGYRVRVQQPLVADDDSEPEPDIAIVIERSYAESHPDRAFLVVEVAESSLKYDRETKAPLYAASNVDEYWIVDVAAQTIEAFSTPVNGEYTSVRRVDIGESLSPHAFPDVVVAVADLVT